MPPLMSVMWISMPVVAFVPMAGVPAAASFVNSETSWPGGGAVARFGTPSVFAASTTRARFFDILATGRTHAIARNLMGYLSRSSLLHQLLPRPARNTNADHNQWLSQLATAQMCSIFVSEFGGALTAR